MTVRFNHFVSLIRSICSVQADNLFVAHAAFE